MKSKIIAILSIFAFSTFSQSVINYSGYNDTINVHSFQGTGAGVTRALNLSQYECLRVSALANDTGTAGTYNRAGWFYRDSLKFRWGIELGNVVMNSSGYRDTTWPGDKYLVDTFDIQTSANMVKVIRENDTLGNMSLTKKYIDTLSVSGFAVQDRYLPGVPWSPIFRFWYEGITGNVATTGFVVLRFSMTRRLYNYYHGL